MRYKQKYFYNSYFLNQFNDVQTFLNFRACQAVSDDALTGVCVTSQECDDMGGDKDGNCAAGFGACCVLT